jgi:hypothetical protein
MRFIILPCVFVWATPFCLAQSKHTDSREKALIARERAYFDAIIAKKYGALSEMLADNYLGTYRAGIIDKTHEAKDLANFPLADYAMTEVKTGFPAPNIGIISFRLHVRIVVEGKDIAEDDYLCCVWTRQGGRWVLSAQTAAKVME